MRPQALNSPASRFSIASPSRLGRAGAAAIVTLALVTAGCFPVSSSARHGHHKRPPCRHHHSKRRCTKGGSDSHATPQCSSPSSTGTTPSQYNTTPPGPGPWQVPVDPCNTEKDGGGGANFFNNCAYWAAEKRPDIWVNAVWPFGYSQAPGGAWNIELDAAQAGFSIDHTPRPGDVTDWPPNATMGTSGRTSWYASADGHVAYVEAVNDDGTITISQMGVNSLGGYTTRLNYDRMETFFIH